MGTKNSFLGTVFFLTAATIGFAAPARAQTCSTDGDCPQSYTCVTSTVIAEPAPACPPGADCAKPEVDAGVPPTVVKFCEPKTCSVDKDCGAGMVCYTQTAEACSGGVAQVGCAANTKCDAGAPTKTDPTIWPLPGSTCTTTTTSQCAFKWQLPCKADADCGDGFACQPSVSVGCSAGSSGGGGTTTSNSGSTGGASSGPNRPVAVDASVTGVPTPPPSDGGSAPSCVTTTSFPGYCQPKASTCATDTDCPATWKCADVLVAVPVANQPTNQPTKGGAAGGPAELMDADLTSDAGAKACVSPLGGGYAYPTSGGVSGGGAPETSGTGSKANADAGVTAATPPGATAGAGASTSDSASSSSAGCSLAGGGAEPMGLMFLALVVLTRARRRSR